MSANTNLQALSSGGDVYAKKRKARQEQLAEVTFDPEARKYDSLSIFICSLSHTPCHCYPHSGFRRCPLLSKAIIKAIVVLLLENKKKTLPDHETSLRQSTIPEPPPPPFSPHCHVS